MLNGFNRRLIIIFVAQVTGSNGGAGQFGGAFEEYRAAAQTEGQAYVADHYATGTLAAFNADNGVTIAIR